MRNPLKASVSCPQSTEEIQTIGIYYMLSLLPNLVKGDNLCPEEIQTIGIYYKLSPLPNLLKGDNLVKILFFFYNMRMKNICLVYKEASNFNFIKCCILSNRQDDPYYVSAML
jgi:hypothetical protein